jgi:2-polyprenyl-3-methyl-5-hydroxy-6-metoxy-1,4-benzoquinol methylase
MILNKHKEIGVKSNMTYWQDNNGIIFCNEIDQSNMVGGGNEEPRNLLENPVRLERFKSLMPEGGQVLDYGCGNGMLVSFLKENEITADGYDKFNPEYQKLNVGYDLVSMIEVVEHLYSPFTELERIYEVLNPGGQIYIETSFSDWLTLDDSYIEPLVGHHVIFSHQGLTELMLSKGFLEGNHINGNARIYIKP